MKTWMNRGITSYQMAVLSFLVVALVAPQFSPAAVQGPYSARTYQLQTTKPSSPLTWRNHGVVYDQFMQVPAYSNRRRGDYQCTELVHRFLKQTYGVPTRIGIGLGDANVLLANIFSKFGSRTYSHRGQTLRMVFHRNQSAQEAPAPGSAVNFSSGGLGHVAVVRHVEVINSQQVRVYLFEQHGFLRWSPGESKPIRSVLFRLNSSGSWSGGNTPGVGTPISWINFVRTQSAPLQ